MSADDQAFLDTLSSVPNEIRRYSNEVADYVDKHLVHVADVLREALSNSRWIPESARPRPPPPPPKTLMQSLAPPGSTYRKVHDWVVKNKVLSAFIFVAIGGLSYYAIRSRSHRKKRRAKRAPNGARIEVVVIVGSPCEPMVRSLSLDLERRGFIVFIVCNSIEEEVMVEKESRTDIRSLMIDILSPDATRAALERFKIYLDSPHSAYDGARSHHLKLRNVIILPSPSYPSAPISTLPAATLSDLLNTRLLNPILTLQAFIPLLTSTATSSRPDARPSVLLLTPSILAPLRPAFHLPECMSVTALSSFADILTAELAPLHIPVTQLHLGTFDLSAFGANHHRHSTTIQSQRAETLRWEESSRLAFGRNYVSASTATFGRAGGRASSLRLLNDAVFDSLTASRGGIVRVGVGSSIYGFVGRWMPRGLVAMMMGARRVRDADVEIGRESDGRELVVSSQESRDTSPGAGPGSHMGYAAFNGSEYVSVDE